MTDEQELHMTSKETALNNISRLVERFDRQYDSYKHSTYNETLTRRDFIDPFFKALGWDMDNENGYAEAYREVIHEDRVKISGYMKAPDYSFRLVGGKRLFFVEAKKPSVYVKGDILPAYQVRRYGWSAKLPVSIITDFEEFSIYDCTKKPDPKDSSSVARTNYLTFREYVNEFDFIYDTFSKENVLRGSFDKFIQGNTGKKGTATVDKEFLLSLDKWRTYLAKAISKENKNLNEDEINFAVQQFIDRIIFLRIAEDRNVEPYGSLKESLTGTGSIYKNLFRLFKTADEKYNSGIFDFKKDKISEGLTLDNKVIKTIISELYYPESPYEFSVLSVEILGSAYEQFLGKQIRISDAHRVTIEDKPEVRKAGGVYYTPQYVVDYIVKNTVGKLIENQPDGKAGKSPKEISKIKIVDPACGSGSFLLGAYQYLLDYHKDFYSQNGKIKNNIKRSGKNTKEEIVLTPEGNLTTAEKKRILTNNIFGVDIDTNAVEVTKLSLLLKCMEGETDASIATQTKLWNERVLPNIDNNIKSGNSLIDTDFYDGELDFGDEKKIKPFNWQKAFPEVFAQGGFDAVIGNPPYVRIQSLTETSKESVIYFNNKYETAIYGNYDLYVLFVEKGINLLKENGLLGFILPNKFFNTDYGIGLRKLISNKNYLKAIVDFEQNQVFENATTYCCLLFLINLKNLNFAYLKAIPGTSSINIVKENLIKNDLIGSSPWNFYNNEDKSIIKKLENNTSRLINLPCEISRGSSTGNDNIFVFERNKDGELVNGQNEIVSIEEDILKIPIYATDFNRYNFKSRFNFRILFPYNIESGKSYLIEEEILKKNYPKAYKYLFSKKSELAKRKQNNTWYGYSAARNLFLHSKADILIPLLANKGLFTILPENKNIYTLMAGGGFSISIKNNNFDKKYILGVLNSSLLFWYLKKLSNLFRGGWITCTKQYFSQLPIKQIRLYNKQDISLQDDIVKNVDLLLKLNSEKQTVKLQSKIEQIQSRIDYCEDKIDQAVYELYGLSEEEIKVVEGKGN